MNQIRALEHIKEIFQHRRISPFISQKERQQLIDAPVFVCPMLFADRQVSGDLWVDLWDDDNVLHTPFRALKMVTEGVIPGGHGAASGVKMECWDALLIYPGKIKCLTWGTDKTHKRHVVEYREFLVKKSPITQTSKTIIGEPLANQAKMGVYWSFSYAICFHWETDRVICMERRLDSGHSEIRCENDAIEKEFQEEGRTCLSRIARLAYECAYPENEVVRVEPQGSQGKSVQWVNARSHYTLLHIHHIQAMQRGLRGKEMDEVITRCSHARRGHLRTLTAPRFHQGKEGQVRKVWVRDAWIGPREWKTSGQTYKVIDHLGA